MICRSMLMLLEAELILDASEFLRCRCRPTASTYDISITLAVHYENYSQLKEYLQSALIEGHGLGLV